MTSVSSKLIMLEKGQEIVMKYLADKGTDKTVKVAPNVCTAIQIYWNLQRTTHSKKIKDEDELDDLEEA